MAGSTCPNCGASLSGGAAFCAYCGSSVSGGGPLTTGGGTTLGADDASYSSLPQGSARRGAPSSGGTPQRGRTLLIAIVVIVVALLVFATLGLYLGSGPGSNSGGNVVYIVEFDIWAPDNACGLNSNPIGFDGNNQTPGSQVLYNFDMPNYNSTNCTITSFATNSSGFSSSGANVPLLIPGSPNPTNPVAENLNLTLTVPDSGFTGYVNLVVT